MQITERSISLGVT